MAAIFLLIASGAVTTAALERVRQTAQAEGMDVVVQSLTVTAQGHLVGPGLDSIIIADHIELTKAEAHRLELYWLITLADLATKSFRTLWRELPKWQEILTLAEGHSARLMDASAADLLVEDLEELDLNVKTYNLLRGRGKLRSIRQVMLLTDADLLGIAHFDDRCLADLKEKLARTSRTPE